MSTEAPRAVPGWQELSRGDYLAALEHTRAAVDDKEPITYDPLVYLLGALGRHEEALALRAKRFELERAAQPKAWQLARLNELAKPGLVQFNAPKLSRPEEVNLADAAPRLIEAVRSRQVVILAEEHHAPEHRAFGARILGQLSEAGVTHLALETGHQEPLDQAIASGLVKPNTEGFAFEPQRSALLRSAIAARSTIVAFDVADDEVRWMQDHPEQAMAYREETMARHIRERILACEPDSRVLVWVGMGHAQRRSGFGGLKMMVDWLCEWLDEEPFSGYQLTGDGNRPGVDLIVRHPEPMYLHGRPSWLRTRDRVAVAGHVEPTGERLVQAIAAGMPAATPVDQFLAFEDGLFELLLPPGDYLLRALSSTGLVAEQAISVGHEHQFVELTG